MAWEATEGEARVVFTPARRRTWEDRLAVRFPRLYGGGAALVWSLFDRLPVGNRTRRRILARIAGRSYGAFVRRDLDAIQAMYHPECVFDYTHFDGWPDQPIYPGKDGLRKVLESFDPIGIDSIEPIELQDLGNQILLGLRIRGEGVQSSIPISGTVWQLAQVKDGLVFRVNNYRDREQAAAEARAASSPTSTA
jgi:hypothetical protein